MIVAINPIGIPSKCEKCGALPEEGDTVIKVSIVGWSESDRDGNVVCSKCGTFIRCLNT